MLPCSDVYPSYHRLAENSILHFGVGARDSQAKKKREGQHPNAAGPSAHGFFDPYLWQFASIWVRLSTWVYYAPDKQNSPGLNISNGEVVTTPILTSPVTNIGLQLLPLFV